MNFREEDYPALYLAANLASANAKASYLNLTRGTLILLVISAGLGITSAAFDREKSAFAVASAVLLALSILLTTYLKASRLEQLWYGGRAVAESAKTMTWRYMMGADPYFIDLDPELADSKFISELESILKERKQLSFGFGGEFTQQPQISAAMRTIRSSPIEDRKKIYRTQRIADQRCWYGRLAKKSRSADNSYFVLILASQFLAFVAAIVLIEQPETKVKLTGLFTSLAGALIAWLQVKQHKEVAQSYSIAELELGFIQEQALHVGDDRQLSSFVGDAENAISREHTLWVARRDRA